MTNMISFPLHIGDFLSETMHMDTLEKGAYLMLILSHCKVGVQGLPDDDKTLARTCGVSKKVWQRIKPTLMKQFKVSGSFWVSEKCVEVIQKIQEKSAKQRANALKRNYFGNAMAEPSIRHPQPQPKPEPLIEEDGKKSTLLNLGNRIAHIVGWDKDPSWFGNYSRIEVWLKNGWCADRDILPTVQLLVSRCKTTPKSLSYFEKAIADAHAYRTSPITQGEPLNGKQSNADRSYTASDAAAEILSEEGISDYEDG